jgi:hypothetical protein
MLEIFRVAAVIALAAMIAIAGPTSASAKKCQAARVAGGCSAKSLSANLIPTDRAFGLEKGYSAAVCREGPVPKRRSM